jgi:hypothetical protein
VPAAVAVAGVSDNMKSESGVTAATKAVVASNAAHALVRVAPRREGAEAFVTVFMIEVALPPLCHLRLTLRKPARHAQSRVDATIKKIGARTGSGKGASTASNSIDALSPEAVV